LIVAIVERGANVQAGNVLRELIAAFEYCSGIDKLSEEFANPALLAKSSLKQAKIRLTSQQGTRSFSEKELVKFLHWLPGSSFSQTQKKIIRFTLWICCRTGEVSAAKWDDIDLEQETWHLKETN